MSDTTASTPVALLPPIPERIGRYRLGERLGAGGMGVVFRAHDEELGRDVAIKVLRRAGEDILREAKALAKLRHPNVISLYDAGVYAGVVYLIMEIVEGASLRVWLGEKRRGLRELARTFAAAGRGLLAAHEAGLVHRDFKPDNVLVAADGTVRVADFGLAHPRGEDADGTGPVGTPRYQAPEQREGAPPDPRADQYSFCVSLDEALPAGGGVPAALRRAVARGRDGDPAQRWPSLAPIVSRLERIAAGRARLTAALAALAGVTTVGLVLALVTRPAVAEVCRDPHRLLDGVWDARSKAAVHDAFAATGAPYAEDTFARVSRALDTYTASWVDLRGDTCRAAAHQEQSAQLFDLRMTCLDQRLGDVRALVGVLSHDVTRDVVQRAVASAKLPDLADCTNATQLLAAYPPPATPELRAQVALLRSSIAQARALTKIGRFVAGARMARWATGAADGVAYPPVQAEALAALGAAEHGAFHSTEALIASYRALAASADAHDDARIADTWISVIYTLSQQGRMTDAWALRQTAEIALARAGQDPRRRARFVTAQFRAAEVLVSSDELLALVEEARALYEHEVRDEGVGYAAVLKELAYVRSRRGDFEEALALDRRALEIDVAALGPDHPTSVWSLVGLGPALRDVGRFDEAEAAARFAAERMEQTAEPDDPNVAFAYVDLAMVQHGLGRIEESVASYTRAVRRLVDTRGPDYPYLAGVVGMRGAMLVVLGRYEEARQDLERGVALSERPGSPGAVGLSARLGNLAMCYRCLGRPDDAGRTAERAMRLAEQEAGGNEEMLGNVRGQLAGARVAQRRLDEAEALYRSAISVHERKNPMSLSTFEDYRGLAETLLLAGKPQAARAPAERAVAIGDKGFPPDHPYTAAALTLVAMCDLADHQPAAALPRLERAVAIFDARAPGSAEAARALAALAQALRATGGDAARAAALEARARAFRDAHPGLP